MKRVILALILLLSSLLYTACESEKPEIDETALENVVWVSFYDIGEYDCDHTLVFYPFGIGHETIFTFNKYEYFWESYTFEWYWDLKANTVIMEYENFNLEFEIYGLTKDTLYGKFDGESIGFIPYPR